ncbi:MAG: hypothetical protein ACQKBY_00915 [Verrucomicrobiales bacterium]
MNAHALIPLAFGLFIPLGNLQAEAKPDPFVANKSQTSDPKAKTEEGLGETLKMVFSLSEGDQQVASYTTFATKLPGDHEYKAIGIVRHEHRQWYVYVAYQTSDSKYDRVSCEIRDIASSIDETEGHVHLLRIFSTMLPNTGYGTYTFGEIDGMTLKVDISPAKEKVTP